MGKKRSLICASPSISRNLSFFLWRLSIRRLRSSATKKAALPPSPYHPQKSNPPSSYSSSFLHHLLSPSSFDTAAAVIPPFKAVSPISLSASTLIRRRGRPRASEGYFPRGPKRIKEGKACNDVLHLPTHFFGTILLN